MKGLMPRTVRSSERTRWALAVAESFSCFDSSPSSSVGLASKACVRSVSLLASRSVSESGQSGWRGESLSGDLGFTSPKTDQWSGSITVELLLPKTFYHISFPSSACMMEWQAGIFGQRSRCYRVYILVSSNTNQTLVPYHESMHNGSAGQIRT